MVRQLTIGSTTIDDNSDPFIIAEIGHNHQGSLEKAQEMLQRAKECGANAVKLQKRDNRSLYTRKLYEQHYESENSFGSTYGAHREALEFGRDEYVALRKLAADLGLTMFATAFDMKSADFLASLELPAFKIASGDLKNTPLLRHVARIGKPMIVSTGGGTIDDVQRAYDTIMPINRQLCILQCTAVYPVEAEEMNLRVIETYRERFPDVVAGLSDHQNGIALAIVAYTLGARVFERHFTLNRAWKGTDHAFSLEPVGLRKLVRDLKRARQSMGDGVKRPFPSEAKGVHKMGKKLVAARDLPAGHVLTVEDVAIKSPGDGLPPYELDRIVGRRLTAALAEDDNFSLENLSS